MPTFHRSKRSYLTISGVYCERDINECRDSPCLNGGSCQNLPGGFKCNCTPESRGELCQEVTFTSIASSAFNITIEEIIGKAWFIHSPPSVQILIFYLFTLNRGRKPSLSQCIYVGVGLYLL